MPHIFIPRCYDRIPEAKAPKIGFDSNLGKPQKAKRLITFKQFFIGVSLQPVSKLTMQLTISSTLFQICLEFEFLGPGGPLAWEYHNPKGNQLCSDTWQNASQTLPRCFRECPRTVQSPPRRLHMASRSFREPFKSFPDTSNTPRRALRERSKTPPRVPSEASKGPPKRRP